MDADKNMNKVYINDIVYIESWKDYIKIYLSGGKDLLVKRSLSSMENMLSKHKFLRVHRSYMVSIDKISGYKNLSLQINSTEIPIGRLYKQTVMDKLQSD